MRSIWTDLLSLHGYFVRKEDLAWRDDGTVRPETTEPEPVAGKASTADQAPTPKRRLLRWPRLSVPH